MHFNFFNKKLIGFYKKLIGFIILFIIFFTLVFNNIIFNRALAQDSVISVPQKPNTFADIVSFKNKIINYLSQLIKKILTWFKKIWETYIFPFFHKVWGKINIIFKKEFEEKKPQVQKELKEETKKIKNEIFLFFKKSWQKLKEFFKFNKNKNSYKEILISIRTFFKGSS